MDITGKVKHVGETQEVGSKGFLKRLIVIDVADGQYVNSHGFEFIKDRCMMLNGVEVGDMVTIGYNLGQCREYNGKWYSDHHRAWKIEMGVKKMEAVADSESPF